MSDRTNRLYIFLTGISLVTGINIIIQGSSKFVVPGQPFIFTCTFASNTVFPRHLKKNGTILESVQLGLNDTCYNVTVNGSSPCDQSVCSCSQEEDIFTATWTFESINEPVSIWECEEGANKSRTLILRRAVPVTALRLKGALDVVAGNITSLTCETGQTRPRSYIHWFIGNDSYTINSTSTVTNGPDELTSVTSILTFTPTRKKAHLAVNCVAYNIDPNRTVELENKTKLNVQYPPLSPAASIINNSKTLSVREKTDVTLQCEVIGGNPLAVINWECFNGTVTNVPESGTARSIITFKAMSSFNSELCICSAAHPFSVIQNDSVQINVTYSPKLTTLNPNNTHYIVNETGSLAPINCSADCNPDCSYTWTGPGLSTITGATLHITGIKKEKAGNYLCTASNSLGNITSKIVVIEVNYGPGDSFILDPTSSYYEVNETYQLGPIECRASCKPSCKYKWIIPGQNAILGNNLTIHSIQRSDAGLYKCIAYNSITNGSSKEVNIVVHYAAEVKSLNISKNNFTINEHSTATITCHAEGLPTPQITLLFVRNNTILSQAAGVDLQYRFSSARCEDTGEYKCEAVNKFNPNSPIIKDLFVLCYPRPINKTNTNKHIAYDSGDTLSIATIYIAYPEPTFKWHFKSSMVSNLSELTNGSENVEINNIFKYQSEVFLHVSHITRKSLQEENFGSYIIYASNEVNVTTNNFFVVAQGHPNQPSDVEAKCLDHQSANISWVSEFNNGDPQTFSVQYKMSKKTFVSPEIKDRGLKERFTLEINKLKESSTYNFTVVARNTFGETESLFVNCTTGKQENPDSIAVLGLAIGLGFGSAAVIIIMVLIFIFLIRRIKSSTSKAPDTEMNWKSSLTSRQYDENDEDDMRINELYVSAGPNFVKPGTYGRADGGNKPSSSGKKSNGLKTDSETENVVYAVVQKQKKDERKIIENKSLIHSVVNKTKTNDKEGVKGKKPFNRRKAKDEQERKNNTSCDAQVYENVSDMNFASNIDQSEIEKGQKKKVLKTTGKKNEDKLIYLELDLQDPGKDGSRFVIRGVENKTDYADVDFTKRAEPLLPESESKAHVPDT